jgi:hypothetical protein
MIHDWIGGKPPANVALGTSVETQKEQQRIGDLLRAPARWHWLSLEPLLGPVNLEAVKYHFRDANGAATASYETVNVLHEKDSLQKGHPRNHIRWAVVGGESGKLAEARRCHPDWVADLQEQCRRNGTAFHFKQWGEWKPISEMPEAEHQALYRSNKPAKDGEDQGVLDEAYGKTCIVPTDFVQYDGGQGMHQVDGHSGMMFFGVGKKKSGRRLKGAVCDAFPDDFGTVSKLAH